MILAKVIGNVWATMKHSSLEGKKMLLIQPIDEISGKKNGSVQLAIDSAGAGIGDTVLIIDEGSSCRQILGTKSGPTRTIIAGIVDQVSSKGNTKKYH
jgi:microcompartment protein CcmK/EutM